MRVLDALTSAKIPKSEAEILLSALLGKDRTWILAHGDRELAPHEEERWRLWERRRSEGEPVAHITQTREFYGRPFVVNKHTLVPRPATEKLVETALGLLAKQSGPAVFQTDIDDGIIAAVNLWKPLQEVTCVADIGTGSGCIAVTVACERPDLRVIATDIDDFTLVTAKKNATMLGAGTKMEFRKGRELVPLRDIDEPFLIVSNPPYIPDGADDVAPDVKRFEPHTALFGGSDGADILREIVAQAKKHPHCVGFVIECRKDQSAVVS